MNKFKSKTDGTVFKNMFVGMDVHKNYLQVAVLDEKGRVVTMMPGNQTKGKMANMTAGSNMTGALMKSNMTSAAKSMANSKGEGMLSQVSYNSTLLLTSSKLLIRRK